MIAAACLALTFALAPRPSILVWVDRTPVAADTTQAYRELVGPRR